MHFTTNFISTQNLINNTLLFTFIVSFLVSISLLFGFFSKLTPTVLYLCIYKYLYEDTILFPTVSYITQMYPATFIKGWVGIYHPKWMKYLSQTRTFISSSEPQSIFPRGTRNTRPTYPITSNRKSPFTLSGEIEGGQFGGSMREPRCNHPRGIIALGNATIVIWTAGLHICPPAIWVQHRFPVLCKEPSSCEEPISRVLCIGL